MMFNTTFKHILAISWRSVLLVEETGVPRENHRPVASHWQLYHIMFYRVHLARCSGRVDSFCSTSGTHRVNLVTNPVISHQWGKDREVFTTSGTYPWSFVTQVFHSGQPSHGGDCKTLFAFLPFFFWSLSCQRHLSYLKTFFYRFSKNKSRRRGRDTSMTGYN